MAAEHVKPLPSMPPASVYRHMRGCSRSTSTVVLFTLWCTAVAATQKCAHAVNSAVRTLEHSCVGVACTRANRTGAPHLAELDRLGNWKDRFGNNKCEPPAMATAFNDGSHSPGAHHGC